MAKDDLLEKLERLDERVAALEGKAGIPKERREIIEICLTLPEADINGLRFNEQKVHAVFEKRADGWYHSQEILFLSARNTEDNNSRDILTKYLAWEVNIGSSAHTIREQIGRHFGAAVKDIEIALPAENEGVKQYHGVDWWYWLTDKME